MLFVPVAASWAVVSSLTILLLWGARALAPRIAEGRDYSLVRHLVWLLPAVAASVLMFAAASVWVFLPIAVLVSAVFFLRAAVDAQDGERQRVAFLELYAAYFVVAWGLLVVRGQTAGFSASPAFARELADVVTHFAVPAQWLLLGSSAELSAWAAPETVALGVATTLASNLAAATAATSFALSWFSLAYVSRRLLPEPGLPLLPLPAAVGGLFAAAWVVTRVTSGAPELAGTWAVALLWPAVTAEGIAIIRAAGMRFRSRRVLAVLLVLLLPLLPRLWGFLALVGVLSGLLSLRAFVPPLRAGDGTAWHPTLSLGVRAAGLVVLLTIALGFADRVQAVAASPLSGAPPSTCGQVTMTPTGDQVAFESPWASFSMDATDRIVEAGTAAAAKTCEDKGARLCTSDEWFLACLCTYPAESTGGPQITGNDLLAHRVSAEAGTSGQPRGDEKRLVKRLLEGPPEAVRTVSGEVSFAGGEGPSGPTWFMDCRHRGLARGEGPVGLRCCR